MCTAVCYALAHHFLTHHDEHQEEEEELIDIIMSDEDDLARCFGVARVDACMRACHAFFEEMDLCQPLMLAEMQRWFALNDDHNHILVHEVAGALSGGLTLAADKGLVLLPLDELVHCMQTHTMGNMPVRWVLLLTCLGHTRMLIAIAATATSAQALWLFDPQETRLRRVDAGTPDAALRSLGLSSAGDDNNNKNSPQQQQQRVQYAGLFLSSSGWGRRRRQCAFGPRAPI